MSSRHGKQLARGTKTVGCHQCEPADKHHIQPVTRAKKAAQKCLALVLILITLEPCEHLKITDIPRTPSRGPTEHTLNTTIMLLSDSYTNLPAKSTKLILLIVSLGMSSINLACKKFNAVLIN